MHICLSSINEIVRKYDRYCYLSKNLKSQRTVIVVQQRHLFFDRGHIICLALWQQFVRCSTIIPDSVEPARATAT